MRILCPTCGGKGTISDPKCQGAMCYCDGEGNSTPQVSCQTCGGSGWVDKDKK